MKIMAEDGVWKAGSLLARRAMILLATVFSAFLATGSIGAVAATAPLHSGRWLLDSSGRVLIVHGTNVVNKLAPYTPQALGFDDDDAAFLQENGFNVVRLGIIWAALEPQPGIFDSGYLAQIAKIAQILANHGIYTLLDFHQDEYNEIFGGEGFPAWAVQADGLSPLSPVVPFPGEYYKDPAEQAAWSNLLSDSVGPNGIGLQEYLADAEQYVAKRFASAPMVLGYDVINEPNGGSETNADALIGAMELKLMNAIRTVDTVHMVFYEPQATTFPLVGTSLPAFDVADAGMSFHDYCFEPGNLSESLYRAVCGFILNGAQAKALSRSSSTGDALFMTEFGSGQPYVLQIVTGYADSNMMSWANWAYCACGDPTTAISPASAEGLVINPAAPLMGANINAAALVALVRPYPEAVAGTPTSWFFNTTTGKFTLHYSTTPPAGAVLMAGATTTLFVPTLQYPNGYKVTVWGGHVVSGDGTQTLEVAANTGVKTVTVTIAEK